MEVFLSKQKEIIDEFEKINVNFSKDSASRKTSEYIQKRIEKLDKLWDEFEQNDSTLAEYDDKSSEYFTKDVFSRIKQYYESTRSNISSYTPKPRPPAPMETGGDPAVSIQHTFSIPSINEEFKATLKHSNHDQGAESKTDELLKKQASNFRAFTRTITNIDLENVSEKWEFEDLLRTLQDRWSAIDTLHWELDSELDGSNTVYEKAFSTHERTYNQMKKTINSKLWSVSHRENFTPKMEIPEFSGNYHHWVSFKDLFCETIHNNPSLSNAQRMQFLKSKVRGEAERLIHHLSISSDNYTACWDILNNRYNNTKLIFNSHMNIMMNLPIMQQPTLSHIKKIHDITQECLNAVKNLGVKIDTWDPLLVYLLSQKLDSQTYNDYMGSLMQPRDLPVLKDFLKFLENKFTTLESARRKQDSSQQRSNPAPSQTVPVTKFQKQNPFKKSFLSNPVMSQSTNKHNQSFTCPLCNEAHGIFFCKQFLEMSPANKRKIVVKYNLCKNCLFDHKGNECISAKRCRTCNSDHNTIMCSAYNKVVTPTSSGTSGMTSTRAATDVQAHRMNSNTHVSQQRDMFEILLATAMINVQGVDGSYHTMRALIDQGSQLSLISEKAAQQLSLPRQRCKGVISGIGVKETSCKGQINITCQSIDKKYSFCTDVLVMKNLTRNLPNYTFIKQTGTYLENITLADPDYNISRPVDILLGADVYSNIILGGICRSDQTSPVAQQTRLGWILCGNVKSLLCNVVLNDFSQIESFWQVEDISEENDLSSEDSQCMQFYQETTNRNQDGSYEVRLPLKSNFEDQLGTSKSKAVAQFLQLERKFQKQENISKEYKQFIDEYLALRHMKPSTGNMKPECYLPHHCVVREGSLTTKLRVVFNASSPTSSGKSLNDLMIRGPNLQQDLQLLILKWRQYKVAFTADIEKMFRQIWVHEDDQKLQKIVWRDSKNEILREYQLTTVTYGTKAAPFLAMMTLKQLAKDECENYQGSQAPKVLEESFYMDDLLHGTHTIAQAKQLQQDLINLLKSGGFNLRKWASNQPELLQNVSTCEDETNFEFRQTESTKTLGLRWNPLQDEFSFQSKIEETAPSKTTKRTLLSDISKIFDPLGWLTPLTTKLKMLFQQVWDTKLKWDDVLPEEILSEWDKIRADIKNINKIKISRWLNTQQTINIELHGFCDSSMKAYACIIYCKINGTVVLVAAKARIVSSKKVVTLPRLELCGAELLAKLMSKVLQCLSSYNIKMFGWTDSTAVLGWLQGDINRWKPFVANRVKTITSIMSSDCWSYVKSAENPADCASRGLSASQLHEHSLWWHGPAWLPTFSVEKESKPVVYETDEERKNIKQVNLVTQSQKNDSSAIRELLVKYSSFTKLTRVLAWVRRFISKTPQKERAQYLSIEEIKTASLEIIKQVQQSEFSAEINSLQESKQLDSKSKILNLRPFLDKDGILRVGGRLKNAFIEEDMKNPIIIPHSNHLTDLLIDQSHTLTLHGGVRLTLSELRRKFWIVGGNRAVKKRLRTCVKCRKHTPTKHHQLMGDLPAARINPSRPFYHTGVDFTGHVDVKMNKGRGAKTLKGYVAVFICMVTKAVHLELVSDMSSSAFLAALRRLAARRGAPRHIWSDNGTNFLGASRTLKQEYIDLQQVLDQDFYREITDMEIEWHFQAPSWPSAGGLWEAAVKSLKYHLRRVLGEQKLTYEEFTTLLSQIEACLNSRPLCALSEDPDNLDYLTPSHFLASGPTLTIIETERDERTRWKLTQKIFKDVWQRWRMEYLTSLSARSKWKSPKENIKINDVVLIHDANLPAGKWSMGRVVELHAGKDGYVRVVTLKTKNGLLKRPIIKLSILPISNERSQEAKQTSVTSSKQIQSHERSKPKQSKGRTSFASAIIAIIYFMTMMTTCFCHKINSLSENQGLYFDKIANMKIIRDEWKIIVYYDMYPYWDGMLAFKTYAEHLDNICLKIQERTHCDVIMLQLRHAFNEIEYYNRILLNQEMRARKRRGLINGIGSIARSLFGVLDDEFAEQYSKDIALVQENEKHLALLWKNQTSIVEAEYNLLKRTSETMQKQHKIVNQHIINLEKASNTLKFEMTTMEYVNEFTLSAISANIMLSNLKNIQDTLLDTITNVYNGKFNIHLITPQQLQEELNTISGQLEKDMSLPINNIQRDLQNIYHLLRIKAKMTQEYLIFEVKIPLISRDNYDLYKIIAIPKQVGQNMVTLVPIAEYIGMNLQKDSYIPVTPEEIEQCISHDSSSYMCHLRRPVYQMKTDIDLCVKNERNKCKTNIDKCKDVWVGLSNINTYFYFCCNYCQLRSMCGDQVTATQLARANIISLSESCIVKTQNFSVYSHKELASTIKVKSKIDRLEIPPINHIINVTVELLNNTDMGYNETDQLIKDLSKKLQVMKAESGVLSENISYHDIHHYSVIYVLLFVMVAVGGLVVWRRASRRRDREAAPAAGAPQPAVRATTSGGSAAESQIQMCKSKETANKGTTPMLRKIVFSDTSL